MIPRTPRALVLVLGLVASGCVTAGSQVETSPPTAETSPTTALGDISVTVEPASPSPTARRSASPSASPTRSLLPDEIPLPTSPPGEHWGDALLEDVRLGGDPDLAGGCLWLEFSGTGPPGDPVTTRTSAIWPSGFRAYRDPLRLVGPDGELVARLGDSLSLGGGGLPVDYVIPPELDPCATGQVWAVSEVVSVNGVTVRIGQPAGIALRTFPIWQGADCDAIGVDNPVIGRLEGDPEDPQEPIWLSSADGTRLSIVWPEGFSVRFEPDATLYDELGRVVARAGDSVKLNQVSITEATGTFEDPYYAAGILFDGCYPRQR